MESLGVTVSNEEKIEQLYSGLPDAFKPTISYLRIANQTDFNVIVSTIRDFGVEWEKQQQQTQDHFYPISPDPFWEN
jgi:hypothetical protein